MAETLKEKTAKGLLWGGLSNGVQQVLNLVFGIFLARRLSQSDYGMIGMIAIFSALATTLQSGGFAAAINRKKTVSHEDYNAVFWTSVLASIVLYVVLFTCAPFIASFYDMPELVPLSRYAFLGIIITSIGVAPAAYMFRHMMVREMAILQISSVLIAGVVGIIMAYSGYSYWGLATQNNVCIFVGAVMYFYYTRWHPSFKISFSPIRELLGFSSKLVVTGLFSAISNNIFAVLLGKLYTSHDVGNYTQANKWNNLGSSLVNNMLFGIAQPVFAKTNEETKRQKNVLRKLLRFTALISFPTMFGFSIVAEDFIVILLTERWIESAYILSVLCLAGAFSPLSVLFSNLLISRGRSTIYMWCTLTLCIVQLLAALISSPYGISRMIQVYATLNIGWLLIWFYFVRFEIHISLKEVISDITPYLCLTVLLVIAAELLAQFINSIYLRFAMKVVFVATSYCLLLWILQSTVFLEAMGYLHQRLNKYKHNEQ